jgi:hypothetical protein
MGEEVMADVTGDGVDDEIKIGEQSVLVMDGQTGKRYPAIKVQILGHQIKNFLPETEAKEIAITTSWEGKCTIVYAFRNDSFPAVSDLLPGEIDIVDGNVYGYEIHIWGFKIIYPIIKENGMLKVPEIQKEISNTIQVNAGSSKEINTDIPKNTLVTFLVAVENKDINVAIVSSGKRGESIRIDSKNPIFFSEYYAFGGVAVLNFDNSYSIMTPKTVYYKVTVYNYKPPKEAITAQIKNNMHTIQLSAEDYNTIHVGIYPRTIAEFRKLMPLSLINPVDTNIPAVVDGKTGKSGQVTYSFNPETDTYIICGFDQDGKKLDLILSNK